MINIKTATFERSNNGQCLTERSDWNLLVQSLHSFLMWGRRNPRRGMSWTRPKMRGWPGTAWKSSKFHTLNQNKRTYLLSLFIFCTVCVLLIDLTSLLSTNIILREHVIITSHNEPIRTGQDWLKCNEPHKWDEQAIKERQTIALLRWQEFHGDMPVNSTGKKLCSWVNNYMLNSYEPMQKGDKSQKCLKRKPGSYLLHSWTKDPIRRRCAIIYVSEHAR